MLFPSTFPSMVTPAFDRSSSLFSSSLMLSATAESMNAANFAPSTLLYYTVLLNCEYIGINPNCTAAQRISALAHELGHALFDRKHASSGQAFQDTCFYSLDNSKAERRANIFASELLLSDNDILKPIGYYEFNADRIHMEMNMPSHASITYRAMKYQELVQEFLYTHSDVLTPVEQPIFCGLSDAPSSPLLHPAHRSVRTDRTSRRCKSLPGYPPALSGGLPPLPPFSYSVVPAAPNSTPGFYCSPGGRSTALLCIVHSDPSVFHR